MPKRRRTINQALQNLTAVQKLAIAGALLVAVVIGLLILSSRESLPDFRVYAAGPERKSAFFDYLKPIVKASNSEILALRQEVLRLDAASIRKRDERWMRELAARYEIAHENLSSDDLHAALLRRIDVVPESLALAQAAKESGWGTSRFAREGNSLFGEWCFENGCGIVPNNRAPGRSHEVRSFRSPKQSIDDYLMNLNSHPAYREFRGLRKQLRDNGEQLSGKALAVGLSRYSERGEIYVTEIVNLIRGNDLE